MTYAHVWRQVHLCMGALHSREERLHSAPQPRQRMGQAAAPGARERVYSCPSK